MSTDDRIATEQGCSQLFLGEKKLSDESIISGPRVGLKLRTKDDNEKFFRYSDYRYLIYPQLQHKGKKVLIVPALKLKGWKADEIRKTFGMKL